MSKTSTYIGHKSMNNTYIGLFGVLGVSYAKQNRSVLETGNIGPAPVPRVYLLGFSGNKGTYSAGIM